MDEHTNTSQDSNQTEDAQQHGDAVPQEPAEWLEHRETIAGIVGFLFSALVLAFIPRYLNLEGLTGSVVTWICYLVSIVLILWSVIASVVLVVQSPGVRTLIREVWDTFAVEPVRIIRRRASPTIWTATFLAAAFLAVAGFVHLVVITAPNATGLVEIIVKLVVLTLLIMVALLLTLVTAEVVIKPLFLEAVSPSPATDRDGSIRAHLAKGIRRFAAAILLATEVIAAATVVWQVVRLVLRLFG
jgi:hypothetical protein